METKGSTMETAKLREALASHCVRAAGGRTPVVLKGLDALATKEEVVSAVRRKVGAMAQVDVAGLWTTFGDTRAARLLITKDAAAKLAEERTIQVGPVAGRVCTGEKPKCFRCWGEGHWAGTCKGADRRGRCYRCGQEGHLAAQCRSNEKCLDCDGEGHRTGSRKCNGSKKETNFQEPPFPVVTQ